MLPDPTTLRRPAVLAAFRGWNDAGEAASSVIAHLVERHEVETIITLDGGWYDLRENRPVILRVDGVRTIHWPRTTVALCRTAQRDLILVLGDEPSFDWLEFCDELLDLCGSLGAHPVVVLGAMSTDDPHTRELPVSISASDPDLVWGLGTEPPEYTGPTGITGVLAHRAEETGRDVVSMWVSAPYYAPDGECPKATLALARRVSDVLGIDFDFATLEQRSADWEELVDTAVAEDDDLGDFVRRLEQTRDELLLPTTGDDLAAQIEQYLKDAGN